MPRTKGSRNIKPTKTAIANYYALLRSAADKGDVTAAGWLCQLDQHSRHCSEQRENKRDGV